LPFIQLLTPIERDATCEQRFFGHTTLQLQGRTGTLWTHYPSGFTLFLASDGVAEEIVLCKQTEIIPDVPSNVVKGALRTAFLFQVGNCLEEAALTEMYFVAFAVVLCSIPQMC
jgi:hypothetical protein